MNTRNKISANIFQQSESGQAIVLIALFMVILLAMVGVAIDGGGLFWLWRNAQNAADTASLQAAYDKCTGATEAEWVAQGFEAARINGFNSDGVNNTVTVDLHPLDGVNYVRVRIEAVKPKFFIQLVYRGDLEVIAEALVYCTGAVDFSDLPGMIGLGGCTCGGTGDDRMQFSGSNFRIDGDIHSNCNVKIQNANSANNNGTAEGIDAVGTITDLDKVEESEPAETGVDAIEMPALIDIELYFPDGEIFEAINRANPNYAVYYPGDVIFDNNFPSPSVPLQGLIAVEGNFEIKGNFNPPGDDFGPEGLTVVARGTIYYNELGRDGNWRYYGHNVNNGGHEGVTVRYSRGNGSAIAMYTMFDARENCNGGTTATGIQLKSQGSDVGDIDIDGVVMAPYSLVAWNGPSITARGPIIGWGLDNSGADFHWIPEPSYLQPMAPVMNNAQ